MSVKSFAGGLLGARALARKLPFPSPIRLQAPSLIVRRGFHLTGGQRGKNQIYDSVTRVSDFNTYHLLSVSSNSPLLTLWTTSWCPTCKTVSPLLYRLVESGVGEAEGGVALCTIEYDSPDIMKEGFGHMYVISSVPTLMAFNEHGGRMSTRVMDPAQLTSEAFLTNWIREEARSMGGGGFTGGGLGGRFFKL